MGNQSKRILSPKVKRFIAVCVYTFLIVMALSWASEGLIWTSLNLNITSSSLWTNQSGVATYGGDVNIKGVLNITNTSTGSSNLIYNNGTHLIITGNGCFGAGC